MLRALTVADRAAVAGLFGRAADYVELETGAAPDDATVEDFFSGAPPGGDPAGSVRLGAVGADGGLDGLAEMAFGWPDPADAYIGLLLLCPAARGRGLGRTKLAALTQAARDRGAGRMLCAVLAANPDGLRFWQREGFRPDRVIPEVAYRTRVHDVHRLARALA